MVLWFNYYASVVSSSFTLDFVVSRFYSVYVCVCVGGGGGGGGYCTCSNSSAPKKIIPLEGVWHINVKNINELILYVSIWPEAPSGA